MSSDQSEEKRLHYHKNTLPYMGSHLGDEVKDEWAGYHGGDD